MWELINHFYQSQIPVDLHSACVTSSAGLASNRRSYWSRPSLALGDVGRATLFPTIYVAVPSTDVFKGYSLSTPANLTRLMTFSLRFGQRIISWTLLNTKGGKLNWDTRVGSLEWVCRRFSSISVGYTCADTLMNFTSNSCYAIDFNLVLVNPAKNLIPKLRNLTRKSCSSFLSEFHFWPLYLKRRQTCCS